MGRPVPDPPQLLHAMRPDPEQVRQPTSPSDHRVHIHVTRPVPLQRGHLGNCPAMGFWSMTDLTRTAPAKTLSPVANWVNTSGPMIIPWKRMGSKTERRSVNRKRERNEDLSKWHKWPILFSWEYKSGDWVEHVDVPVVCGSVGWIFVVWWIRFWILVAFRDEASCLLGWMGSLLGQSNSRSEAKSMVEFLKFKLNFDLNLLLAFMSLFINKKIILINIWHNWNWGCEQNLN